MTITVEIKRNKYLSEAEKRFINKNRLKEFGKSSIKDFDRDYEPNTLWFFVKNKNKIVSFGGLRPIKIKYLGKTYDIGGICSTISIEKGKGYGKIMVSAMIDYSKRTGKTILGFTSRENLIIFEKAGLGTEKDFVRRFIYKNPKTGEEIIDNDGNGIYYNSKDNFVKKVLSSKDIVYISIMHW